MMTKNCLYDDYGNNGNGNGNDGGCIDDVDDDNYDTHLAAFTISFKSVDTVVVSRPEAKKNTELLPRVNTKLLMIIMS